MFAGLPLNINFLSNKTNDFFFEVLAAIVIFDSTFFERKDNKVWGKRLGTVMKYK